MRTVRTQCTDRTERTDRILVHNEPTRERTGNGEGAVRKRPFTCRMVRAHIATRHPMALTEEDRAVLEEILARSPELDTA